MTENHLATRKDVASALTSLGFQVSDGTISVIASRCRDIFLDHLSRCISEQDVEGRSATFVGSLLRCLSPETLARIRTVFPEATIEAIADAARATPVRFLSAVDATLDEQHARHSDAKTFLAAIFQPDQAVPNTCGQGQAVSRIPAGNPPAAASSGTSRKFHSVHVYGSNAAICFNATDWNGNPGIMVDAALQAGPRTYDWKNAIHVWLDINEVGASLAVFRRWRKSIEFTGHGAGNDKSFSIEFQGQHFFAKVTAKKAASGAVRAVRILPTNATEVSIMFLTQLAERYPMIPVDELLATVRATHQISDEPVS